MSWRWRIVGFAGLAASLVLAGIVLAEPPRAEGAVPNLKYRTIVIDVARELPPPPPEPPQLPPPRPRPPAYDGPVRSVYLASAGILGGSPLEERDTRWAGGIEVFEDPSGPQFIVHYPRFGQPGNGATNSIFAAHVNYAGYGPGPFAGLVRAAPDDALYITMASGDVYTYTVRSVELIPLGELDMNAVVFPSLDANTERVTLISCGGTFIPLPGGGEYDGRVILVAERWLP